MTFLPEMSMHGDMSYVCIPFILIAFLLCQIMKEIQDHKIKIYEFPDTEDEEDNKLIRKIKVLHSAVSILPVSLGCPVDLSL